MFSFLKKITGGADKSEGGCCMGKSDCDDKEAQAKKEEMKKMEGGCCGGRGHHNHEGADDDHTTPTGSCH